MKKHMMFGKRLSCIALSLMLLLTLAACQPEPSGGVSEVSSSGAESSVISSAPSSMPENSAVSKESSGLPERAVTDQAGRTVVLPEQVDRIVSGYYISSSACIALGLDERLAGIEAKADSRPIYRQAAPALLELPNVGTAKEFDMEGCIALEPDLVILPKRLKDNAETMSSMGIAVLLVNPESTEELLEMVALIAEAAGVPERAEAVTGHFTELSERMEKLAADTKEQPRVYMGANSAYLSTAVSGMYQSELIEKSGGQNVAADLEGDGWTEISYEQLLAFDPDIIVIPSEASYSREDVLSDAQLSALRAVQQEKVYEMPDAFEAWDSPTISGALGMAWMLHVMHPELYSLEELQADAAAYYTDVYGLEIDSAQIGT